MTLASPSLAEAACSKQGSITTFLLLSMNPLCPAGGMEEKIAERKIAEFAQVIRPPAP